ncbi:MAG: PEP-CTERM sorting domain-containing protein [Phycisphaeraceae bacterium]|nr:PEP-CTERM sorting domain-containing protein [Phycisphaeraceae bacterium]
MKDVISSVCCVALTLALCSVAQAAPVFSEDFGTLADTTVVTDTTTNFNYRTAFGTMDITNPSTTDAALHVVSTGSGNIVTGLGVHGLSSSSVFTVELSLNIARMPGGTSISFAMGQAGGTMYPAQGGNPPRIDNTTNYAAWNAQSLFVLKMTGNGALGSDFGLMQSMSGGVFSWVDNTVVFNPNQTHVLHLVANGSAASIILGSDTINAGQLGIYVDNVFVGSVAMSNSVAADTFAIYAHGRSANGDYTEGVIDNVKIWQEAVAVPEPATAALMGISLVLLARCR